MTSVLTIRRSNVTIPSESAAASTELRFSSSSVRGSLLNCHCCSSCSSLLLLNAPALMISSWWLVWRLLIAWRRGVCVDVESAPAAAAAVESTDDGEYCRDIAKGVGNMQNRFPCRLANTGYVVTI